MLCRACLTGKPLVLIMKIYNEKQILDLLSGRGGLADESVSRSVSEIISNVRKNGDRALMEYCRKFDGTDVDHLELSADEIRSAASKADPVLIDTMKTAAKNIEEYHIKQLSEGYEIKRGGRTLGRTVRPLKRVGVYVPGGTAAYPSTVLMNCIPARVASVEEIILVTPPKEGGISPAIAAAAEIAGVTRIFTVGGAQAVAALAFGTESIPRVDKIVGPGNAFVAEAKRQVFGAVDIDMIAGPSEVLIVSDGSADPEYIAADLLAQAEHDKNASAILITTDEKQIKAVGEAIERQLNALERESIARTAIENYGGAVLCETIEQAFSVADKIAPEHLEILTCSPREHLNFVKNAGSVFIGEYTCESLGDYFAGTNHVLPTNGAARYASPLSCDDFVKKMSYLEYTKDAFAEDALCVERFAKAEGLTAHANAAAVRRKNAEKK